MDKIKKNMMLVLITLMFVVVLFDDLIGEATRSFSSKTTIEVTSLLSTLSEIGLWGFLLYFLSCNHFLEKENKKLKIRLKTKIKEQKVLKNLLHLDELTKLFNRAALDDWRKASEPLLKTSTETYSVVCIDIDHFKKINDNYGHSVGDKVLQQFAEILEQSCLSESDFAVRWGGEEFMIICSQDKYNAKEIAKMIQLKMKNKNWQHGEALTCSIGIANIPSENGLEIAMKLADETMYRAKQSGRDKIIIHEETKNVVNM